MDDAARLHPLPKIEYPAPLISRRQPKMIKSNESPLSSSRLTSMEQARERAHLPDAEMIIITSGIHVVISTHDRIGRD